MHRDNDENSRRRDRQPSAADAGGFKGYYNYGNPPDHQESLQHQYGGLGAREVGAQRRPYDPEYEQWREQQVRDLDEEYGQWRQERQKKFSDEFEQWRKNRQSGRQGLAPAASSGGGSGS